MVDVDLIVKDREHILVEVKSSVSRGDVYELWRIGKLYERIEGVKPKLVLVSPYIEDTAKKTAEKLGIETHTLRGPLIPLRALGDYRIVL